MKCVKAILMKDPLYKWVCSSWDYELDSVISTYTLLLEIWELIRLCVKCFLSSQGRLSCVTWTFWYCERGKKYWPSISSLFASLSPPSPSLFCLQAPVYLFWLYIVPSICGYIWSNLIKTYGMANSCYSDPSLIQRNILAKHPAFLKLSCNNYNWG